MDIRKFLKETVTPFGVMILAGAFSLQGGNLI